MSGGDGTAIQCCLRPPMRPVTRRVFRSQGSRLPRPSSRSSSLRACAGAASPVLARAGRGEKPISAWMVCPSRRRCSTPIRVVCRRGQKTYDTCGTIPGIQEAMGMAYGWRRLAAASDLFTWREAFADLQPWPCSEYGSFVELTNVHKSTCRGTRKYQNSMHALLLSPRAAEPVFAFEY